MGNLFRIFLPVGNRSARFQIDSWPNRGFRTGLEKVDGEGVLVSSHSLMGQIITDLKPHDLEVSVRIQGEEAAITSTLDSTPLHHWSGPISALDNNLRPPDWPAGTLALATSADDWVVSSLKVKRMNGTDASVSGMPPMPAPKVASPADNSD